MRVVETIDSGRLRLCSFSPSLALYDSLDRTHADAIFLSELIRVRTGVLLPLLADKFCLGIVQL